MTVVRRYNIRRGWGSDIMVFPAGSEPICVAMEGCNPVVFMRADPEQPLKGYRIAAIFSEEEIPFGPRAEYWRDSH